MKTNITTTDDHKGQVIWVFNYIDMEADNPAFISSVRVFKTREEAFECMERTMSDDINNGIVEEDELGGEKTSYFWEVCSSNGRFIYNAFKSYL